MVMILNRVPGTAIFVNAPMNEHPWETRTCFCFYDASGVAASDIALDIAQATQGAFAFIPANSDAPFRTLEATMASAIKPGAKLLIWTDKGWAGRTGDMVIVGSSTIDPVELRFWDFRVLRGTSTGAAILRWICPAGASVSFTNTNLVVTSNGMALVTTIDNEIHTLPVASNTVSLVLDEGPRCGLLTGSLDSAESAKLASLLTPQVQYRWGRDYLPTIKSARLLSETAADHVDIIACFELHRFDQSLNATRIKLEAASSTSQLSSCITDTMGHDLHLTPSDGAAIHFETGGKMTAYASLHGKFRIVAASAPAGAVSNACEVMPGSTGTEFFQLLGRDGYNGIEFIPRQHAFVKFGTDANPPELTEDAMTVWIAPCRTDPGATWATDGFKYVAQPQEQPLYSRRDVKSLQQQDSSSTVLFDPAARCVSKCMPFFPFRGVPVEHLDKTRELDTDALSHVRALIAAESAAASPKSLQLSTADTLLTRITTPDGLLVDIDDQNDWHKIILGGGADWSLEINRPEVNGRPVRRWALQEALSRSHPFLVIGQQLAAPLPGPEDPAIGDIILTVKIGGWPITVTVVQAIPPSAPPPAPAPGYPGSRPVLIMKLSIGKLDEMLANLGVWSLAHVFNNDPKSVSIDATAALHNLDLLARGESPIPLAPGVPAGLKNISPELVPHYRELHKKINDPNWTGIVVLNANTPLNGVPGHVSVVTQGEEMPSAFGVPVLGIDLNRVVPDPTSGQMLLEKTSAFGAIHYHSPEPLKETDKGFAFKVRGVNAIFQNTTLSTFLATMQLRLAEYFGEESKPQQPLDKSRLLDIVGRYEGTSDAYGKGQYIFRALGSRTMDFEGKGFLSALSVTRIDLTCKHVDGGSTVESRFVMWGELEFGTKFRAVTGVRKISYENAALILHGDKFDVDAGNVRVELDKTPGSSDMSGLLAKFPFQLTGLRWAPKVQSLDSIGFAHFGLPAFPDLGGTLFEFGIELDLNLGSMGKLFEAAEFLKARILVGWHIKGQKPEFSIGFRFMGGSGPLDIGINGVMRLTATEVNLKTYDDPAGIGIGLLNPQLEVMGYKVPSEPKDTLVAFLPSGKDNIAWAWARRDTDVTPLKLDYFAIGQRVSLVPPGAWSPGTSLNQIVDASIKQMQPTQDGTGVAKLPDIGRLYAPEAGWGVVARGSVSTFKFRFVFMDGIDRYGLGIDIPNIAKVDVLYRKLSDGVGIFSAEIEPEFRSFEMGAATITLPIVGFDALTNGGWSINIGYHGNDFSRGTTVQVLPLLGSGGIRFGRLDWRSSYVLNSPESTRRELIRELDLNPVIEVSLAARVGIGKEIREGVFNAGITLSVYGIFEGALGMPRDQRYPADRSKRYMKIYGAAGVLLEIFGTVSFAIVTAAVSVRVWVETGITFETWAPVIVHAEAGVSVYVRVVIARFSVFGSTIEISISFSFSTRIRVTEKIADSFDGSMPDIYRPYARQSLPSPSIIALEAHEAVTPLDWVLHKVSSAPARQSCAVTLEPMISDGRPVLLPMLVASGSDSPGITIFATGLFKWALRLSLGLRASDPNPSWIMLSDLRKLQARLEPPKGKTLSRWGNAPLNFAHLQPFLEEHLALDLCSVSQMGSQQAGAAGLNANDTATALATLIPWFADLALHGQSRGASEVTLRDFRGVDAIYVDDSWEQALYDELSQSRPQYPLDASQRMKLALLEAGMMSFQVGAKNALDVVVEDWAAALVQGMTHRAVQAAERLIKASIDAKLPPNVCIDSEPCADFDKLFDELLASEGESSPAAQTVQHASTFLHHGLRVPPVTGGGDSIALSQLLKTELPLEYLAANGNGWKLTAYPRAGFTGGWLSGISPVVDEFNANEALTRLESLYTALGNEKVMLEVRLEDDDLAGTTRPRRFSVPAGVAAGPAGGGVATLRMLPVPRALQALVQRKGALNVEAKFHDLEGNLPPTACKQRWFTRIELRLGAPKVAANTSYPLLNVDQRIRDLLILINEAQGVPVVGAWLAFGADEDAPTVPLRLLNGDDVLLFVSNFSREPAPELFQLKSLSAAETPAYSTMATPEILAQLLWMSATVNGPGFELACRKGNPLAHLFKDSTVASVGIVFELSSPSLLLPIADGLLIDEAEASRNVVVETLAIRELVTATPDGQVAIKVRRKNPFYTLPATSFAVDLAALASRYELADYETKAGASSLFSGAPAGLSRGSVVPVRVNLDEEGRELVKAQPPECWVHRLLVPLARIAESTAVRYGTAGATSPYEFVGTNLQSLIVPGLRDGAGHYLDDSKIELTWVGDTRVLYRDALPQLQEMPGVVANWQLDAGDVGPSITVMLEWSAGNLFDSKFEAIRIKRREALLAQYSRWLAMCVAPDFRANAEVALDGLHAADMEVTQAVRQWLARIIKEIDEKTDKDCRCSLLAIVLPATSLPTATSAPFPMEVAVTFRRDESLCDQRLWDPKLGDSDIWLARSAVVPKSLQSEADWTTWALSVKKIFGGRFTLLRRQRSPLASKGERGEVTVVNLIRRDMLNRQQLRATSTSFHAPAPLAKALRNGKAIVPMPDGQTEQVEVVNLDMNAVTARSSSALEAMLDARAASALCLSEPDLYRRLAAAKRGIADNMADRLATVLRDGTTIGDVTRMKFRDASRANLRTAFAPVTLVEVQLSAPTIADPKTFLWGQVEVAPADSNRRAALSFSSIRIPLGTAGVEGGFHFVVSWADPGTEPIAVLDGPMTVRPHYVEVQGKTEIDGYRPSDWYEVIWTGELGTKDEFVISPPLATDWTIPLPLRLIPPTPSILRHSLVPDVPQQAHNLDEYMKRVRAWTYVLAMMVPATNHDTTEVTVRFDDTPALWPFSTDLLFQALAAFSRHEQMVSTLTTELIEGTRPDSEKIKLMVRLFEDIAVALASTPLVPVSLYLAGHTRKVTLSKRPAGSRTSLSWRVEPTEFQPTVTAALLHMTAKDPGDASDPITPDSMDLNHGTAQYRQTPAVDSALGGIAGLSPRQVQLSALDIMLHGSAMPHVMSRRNAELLGAGTPISEAFIFETAAVETPDPLIPHLIHIEAYNISAGVAAAKPLSTWLAQVRDALLRDTNIAAFTLDISARFKLPLTRGGNTIDYYKPLPSLKEVKLAGDLDWVSSLAGYVYASLQLLENDTRERGTLELKLQVFHAASSGEKRPALSLQKLELPLSRVSLKAVLPAPLAPANSAVGAGVPIWRVAAYVSARMRGITGDEAKLSDARIELAKLALTGTPQALEVYRAPLVADLDTQEAAHEWALCNLAAAKAIAGQLGGATYAVLEWGPAADGTVQPRGNGTPWLMTALVDDVVAVAGPVSMSDGTGDEEVFLWGLPRT